MRRSAILLALLFAALLLGSCAPAPTAVPLPTTVPVPTFMPVPTSAPVPTTAPTVPPTAVSPTSVPTATVLPTKAPTAAKLGGEIIVSAAADLQTAFTELGSAFEKETGTHATFNFGSTGQLAQQISQGAPVDLFAAADRSYINDLVKQGFIISDTVQLYARGRITLWTRQDSTLKLQSLTDLTKPEVKHIAIANPEHAPYGVAAREALQSVGIWDAVQPKLVFGDNVAQTKQLADSGNVEAAIIALSLSVGVPGHWTLIPQELHNPLDQALGVVKTTKNERGARAFIDFVNGPAGRTVMAKYGFVLPGEEKLITK